MDWLELCEVFDIGYCGYFICDWDSACLLFAASRTIECRKTTARIDRFAGIKF